MPTSTLLRTVSGFTVAAALAGGTLFAQGPQGHSATLSPVGALVVDTIGETATPVYAVSFGVTQSATDPGGGGGGAGKATFSGFTISRQPDALSPQLFKAAATGQHIKDVQIDVLRTGSNSVDSTYILTDVLVSSFSTDAQFEKVTFTYSKIEVVSGGSRTCWNLATNAGC